MCKIFLKPFPHKQPLSSVLAKSLASVSPEFSRQLKKERKSSVGIKTITILTIIKRHCAEIIENR